MSKKTLISSVVLILVVVAGGSVALHRRFSVSYNLGRLGALVIEIRQHVSEIDISPGSEIDISAGVVPDSVPGKAGTTGLADLGFKPTVGVSVKVKNLACMESDIRRALVHAERLADFSLYEKLARVQAEITRAKDSTAITNGLSVLRDGNLTYSDYSAPTYEGKSELSRRLHHAESRLHFISAIRWRHSPER